MNRSNYATHQVIAAGNGYTIRDPRAPAVIRAQRAAIAEHDKRKRNAARLELLACLIATAAIVAVGVLTFITATN